MIIIVSTSRIKNETSYYSDVLIKLGAGIIIYDIAFYVLHLGSNSKFSGIYVAVLLGLNLIGFIIKIGIVVICITLKVEADKNKSLEN